MYVAEGGINSVAVLDTTDPVRPKLVGRLPTGWWPSALIPMARRDADLAAEAKKNGGDGPSA